MKLIVAVDKNWAIGLKGKLLVSIPEDMKFFRRMTTDHVVVMGRKTLESFPNGLPLKNRTNIVLTRKEGYDGKGAIVVKDEEELKEELKKYDSDDIFVIGGETVYRMLEPECDEAYITKVDYEYEADAYFPDLDKDDSWKIAEESEEQTYFNIEYKFVTYRRK